MIMPGVYNENITTKQYVAIKGAEAKSVVITSSVGTISTLNGTINVSTTDSPLENLTIENTDPGLALAVNVGSYGNLEINKCFIMATGNVATGVSTNGIYSIKNTDIKAVGSERSEGISATPWGYGSIVENCAILAESPGGEWTIGFHAKGYENNILNSTIFGTSYSIRDFGGGTTVRVRNSVISSLVGIRSANFYAAASQFNGGIITEFAGGVRKVINCYDGNFNPIPNE